MGSAIAAHGPELGQHLHRRVWTNRFVGGDLVLLLAPLHRDRHDLLREPALVGRASRELVGAGSEPVHVGAADLELVRHLARLGDHLLAGERVGQPVVGHRVHRLDVAHLEPEPGTRQEVGSLRHRFHPAGDRDPEVARADRLVGEPDRAHARGADLVDRIRGRLARDPGLGLCLARGDLPLTRLQHLPVDHLLDLVGADLGPLERAGDRFAAQLRSVEGGEGATHLRERGPGGREDHGARHISLS